MVGYRLWNETFTLLKQFGHREGDHVLLTHTGRPWVRDQIVNGREKRATQSSPSTSTSSWVTTLKLYRKTGATVLSKKYPDCVELYLGHSPDGHPEIVCDSRRERFDEAINWLGQQFGF